MRYIRKVLAIGLAIVFLIALVIGAGVIFSVRNINVTYVNYSSQCNSEYEECRDNLKTIKGSSILFLKDKDIREKITRPQTIAVAGYEKVYPCTVNVILKERVEVYALATMSGYALYDEDGIFIKNTESTTLPMNAVDGCPDVLLNAKEEDIAALAQLCGWFGENFSGVRRLLESVSTESFFGLEIAEFRLRSGMAISVSEWKTAGEQKMSRVYEVYSNLSDSERIKGVITVVESKENSLITAQYSGD